MSLETAFRAQLGSWSARFQGNSPFADWTDYVRSGANNLYDQLPTYNSPGAATREPLWFQLSRLEKIVGFACCLAALALCFTTCFFIFPVLALKPRKFALLWTMGLLLFVVSFGVLQGPYAYTRHLLSRERIVFTTVFFGSVAFTLFSAVVAKLVLLTLVASVVEVFAILYYAVSYFPFGAATITWFTSYALGYFGGLVGAIF